MSSSRSGFQRTPGPSSLQKLHERLDELVAIVSDLKANGICKEEMSEEGKSSAGHVPAPQHSDSAKSSVQGLDNGLSETAKAWLQGNKVESKDEQDDTPSKSIPEQKEKKRRTFDISKLSRPVESGAGELELVAAEAVFNAQIGEKQEFETTRAQGRQELALALSVRAKATKDKFAHARKLMSRKEKDRKSSIFKAKALTAKVLGHLRKTRKWHSGGAPTVAVRDDDDDDEEASGGEGDVAPVGDQNEDKELGEIAEEEEGGWEQGKQEEGEDGEEKVELDEEIEATTDERRAPKEGEGDTGVSVDDKLQNSDDSKSCVGSPNVATFASWKRNFSTKARKEEERKKNQIKASFEARRKHFTRTSSKLPSKKPKVRLVKDELSNLAEMQPAKTKLQREKKAGAGREGESNSTSKEKRNVVCAETVGGSDDDDDDEEEEASRKGRTRKEDIRTGPATSALDEAFHELFVEPYTAGVPLQRARKQADVKTGTQETGMADKMEVAGVEPHSRQLDEEKEEKEEEPIVDFGSELQRGTLAAAVMQDVKSSPAKDNEKKEEGGDKEEDGNDEDAEERLPLAKRLQRATAPFAMGSDTAASKLKNAMSKMRSIAMEQEQDRAEKEEEGDEEDDSEDSVSRVLISDYLLGDEGGIDPEKRRHNVIRRLQQRTKVHAVERRRARIRAKISAKAAWKQMNSKSASLRANPLLPYAANSPLDGFVHLPVLMHGGSSLGAVPSFASAISDEEIDAIVSRGEEYPQINQY